MSGYKAYAISGNLSLIILNLAFIGAITVIVIIIKILLSIFKTDKKTTKPNVKPQWEIEEAYERSEQEKQNEYYQSTYYLATKNKYNDVLYDKGLSGEYKIYKTLKFYERFHGARFLFNCYLPREHNETTEIDVILLTHDGIFVFESKNYNGWIFGSENQELWTQTLPSGNNIHKTHFYNPVKQNKTHIKYLKKIIGYNLPIYSIIVFSNECNLKDIEIIEPFTKVIKLNFLINIIYSLSVKTQNSISHEQLVATYNKLYPYTQVSDIIKMHHIENINKYKTKFDKV